VEIRDFFSFRRRPTFVLIPAAYFCRIPFTTRARGLLPDYRAGLYCILLSPHEIIEKSLKKPFLFAGGGTSSLRLKLRAPVLNTLFKKDTSSALQRRG